MMNYEKFETTIKKLFEAAVGSDIQISSSIRRKNNNTLHRGLAFKVPGENFAPVIYLETAYQAYQNGISISDIYEKLYHKYKSLPLPENNINALLDFENVKDKIVYKLVNYEQNEVLLKEIPYVPYLDLAITFYLLLDINQNGAASMMIYNETLAIWGIDSETLFSYAKENTPKLLPVSIQSMTSVMCEIDPGLVPDFFDVGMLILSNIYNNLGAGCILYNNVLKDLGDRLHGNFFLLPSSTHEWIIIPQRYVLSSLELKAMIREVNQELLDLHEILSDHPYYYDLQKGRLMIAA